MLEITTITGFEVILLPQWHVKEHTKKSQLVLNKVEGNGSKQMTIVAYE